MKGCLKVVGFGFLGLILLGVVIAIFGGNSARNRSADTNTQAASSASQDGTLAETTSQDSTKSQFDAICKTDPSWTEAQTEQHLAGFAGQPISDWGGWVYEVRGSDGQYTVLVAMSPPGGLLWTRNIEISGVPTEIALVLQKEQPIRFSGTIARIDRFFGANCNPLIVRDATFAGIDAASASPAVGEPTAMEATFANICETDPAWTEIQTESYLAGFAGREITDWDGWVYEVREFNGQYDLLVAMDSPGGFAWARDVEISGIPAQMALALQKEQPIRFSGNIARVDRAFGTNCNPIVVQDATFPGVDTARAAASAPAAVTDPATVEATFNNICVTDPGWTEIQTQQYLSGFAGREITNWDGWVYEVSEFNGQYKLSIAMEPSGGMVWSRDVEIPGIPAEMAVALQKDQPIRFSGRIAQVDRVFGANCNPVVVQDATFSGLDIASAAANAAAAITDPATVEATYTNICKTDPSWTEIQTGDYLAGFAGREITDWNGWVYEVLEFNGQYKLLVAMEPPGGLMWARNVEIPGIPADMAISLQKERPIQFSGRIAQVNRMFGANCNPIIVQDAVFE